MLLHLEKDLSEEKEENNLVNLKNFQALNKKIRNNYN